jgi:hypothetical protein
MAGAWVVPVAVHVSPDAVEDTVDLVQWVLLHVLDLMATRSGEDIVRNAVEFCCWLPPVFQPCVPEVGLLLQRVWSFLLG